MRLVRVQTAALLVAVVALIGALAAGTHLAGVKADEKAQAAAAHALAASTWPRGLERVPNASKDCPVVEPAICLKSPDASSKQTASMMAIAVGSKTLEESPVPGAPSNYTVHGTIGNARTPVVVTVRPHLVGPASSAAKITPTERRKAVVIDRTSKLAFLGSDVTVSLLADDPTS